MSLSNEKRQLLICEAEESTTAMLADVEKCLTSGRVCMEMWGAAAEATGNDEAKIQVREARADLCAALVGLYGKASNLAVLGGRLVKSAPCRREV